jgi:uncharacterized caspase-like protein
MMSGRFKAVLIGNSEFPDEPELRSLRCAIRDVEGFCEVLSSETHGPDGPYQVELLRNESHGVITKTIFRVLKAAQQDDLVLIYYSGHGKLDSRGELYLASHDTTSELLPASSVPIERIKSFIRLSKAKRVVWIMDCCFSGAVERLFKGDIADQASQTIQSSLDDGCGTYILTASTSVGMAEEKEGEEYSVFTKHLISGIREGKADKDDDGYVSIQELFEYLRSQVPKDGQQEPRGWFLNTGGRLNIAKTGKPARAIRRQELRDKILDAAKTAYLPRDVVAANLTLLDKKPEELWNSEKALQVWQRLEQLSREPSLFIAALYRVYQTAESPSVATRPLGLEQTSSPAERRKDGDAESATHSPEEARRPSKPPWSRLRGFRFVITTGKFRLAIAGAVLMALVVTLTLSHLEFMASTPTTPNPTKSTDSDTSSPTKPPDSDSDFNDIQKMLGPLLGTTAVYDFKGIGIQIIFVTREQSASLQLPPGAMVSQVENGPAAEAGIHAKDVIMEINGTKIAAEDDLRRAIRKLGPGKISVKLRRGNDVRSVVVDCPNC